MDTILNFSEVYDDERWTVPGARVIDLKSLEGTCCYCDPDAARGISEAMADAPLRGLHWIDTGDYHYVSKLWMDRIREPFALALFDNHPDDMEPAFGGLLSCGSWVLEARRSLPLMKADRLNTSCIPGVLPVYLSIDLDVLSTQFARTDWSQGDWSLDRLFSEVSAIAAGHSILGADICGGLTSAKGGMDADFEVNRRTRDAILDYFSSHPLLAG